MTTIRFRKSTEPRYRVFERVSQCGLWKIVKREFQLPVRSTTFEIHMLAADGSSMWVNKNEETLRDARAAVNEFTTTPEEFFNADSAQIKRIREVYPA